MTYVCPPHNRHALPSIICPKQKVDPCLFFLAAIFSMTLPLIPPCPIYFCQNIWFLIYQHRTPYATQNMRPFYLSFVKVFSTSLPESNSIPICQKTSNKQDLFIKLKKKCLPSQKTEKFLMI